MVKFLNNYSPPLYSIYMLTYLCHLYIHSLSVLLLLVYVNITS